MQDQIVPSPKKPSSEKRIAAARANGAKSRGPKTPEGRLKCAQAASNQCKHNMLADSILLKGESRKSFTAMLEHYYQAFQPRTDPERDIIKKMAVSYWRQMRTWSTAQTQFNQEIGRQNPTLPTPVKASLAADTLNSESQILQKALRYETAYDRRFRSALRDLELLREFQNSVPHLAQPIKCCFATGSQSPNGIKTLNAPPQIYDNKT